MFENHAQDSRVREMPDVSPTQGAQLCNAPANNPLVVTQYGADLAGTLRAEGADSSPTDSSGQNAVAIGFKGGQSANGGLGDEREVAPTLAAQPSALEPTVAVGLDLYNQAETGGGVAMTVRAAAGYADTTPCVALEGNGSRPSHMGDGYSTGGASFTLNTIEHHAVAVRTAQTGANGCGVAEECAHTLDRAEGQALACGMDACASADCGIEPGVSRTLRVCSGGGGVESSRDEYVVRRLTPRECERLQGFPDDWTLVPYRGKPADQCPDGPRYKAMGNSWGTNCAEWILRRILAARHVWHRETSTETKGKNESQC